MFYWITLFDLITGKTGAKMSICMAVRRFFANHRRITTNLLVFTIKQRKIFTCAETTTQSVANRGILVRFVIVYIVNLSAICDGFLRYGFEFDVIVLHN